jgi:hypothetical protein
MKSLVSMKKYRISDEKRREFEEKVKRLNEKRRHGQVS